MFSVQRILYFYLELSNCFDKIYVPLEINRVHTRSSYQKLNVPDRKLNVGQKGISYVVGPSLWNFHHNLNKTLQTSTSLNAFKYNIKQHYFNDLGKKSLKGTLMQI